MDAKEKIGRIRRHFENSVKPYLETSLEIARMEVVNIYMTDLEGEEGRALAYYAQGIGFIASARIIVDKFDKGKLASRDFEMYQMYLGQLEMAISSGNRG